MKKVIILLFIILVFITCKAYESGNSARVIWRTRDGDLIEVIDARECWFTDENTLYVDGRLLRGGIFEIKYYQNEMNQ
jgi:hypothetical protein